MKKFRGSSTSIPRIVSAMVIVCLFGSVALGQPWDGNGVEGDPYLIYDANDMQAIGADANYWGSHFKLMADINMISYGYTTAVIAPDLNDANEDFDGIPFTGRFDGNGHIIANLTIDTQGLDKNHLGLFGKTNSDAVVVRLGLENIEITGSGNQVYLEFTGAFGALVGENAGVVQRCWSSGSVTGGNFSEDMGGLCGWNQSTGSISMCYSIGSVTGDANSGGLGGLCGSNDGSIANCWSDGSVTGRNSLGGLCGFLDGGSITNSYSTGTVNGTTVDIGGLCGERIGGTVSNSFWDIDTSGMSTSNGGTGKTTAEMKQITTFTNWDFIETWGIEDNQTYPFLKLAYPVGDLNYDHLVDMVDFAIFAQHWLEENNL